MCPASMIGRMDCRHGITKSCRELTSTAVLLP